MTKHTEAMMLLEKHFDIALETPDGIKKLRELILTLAMQGKLVKQDPNDQPASELLKEIEAEKKRLLKEGKIKKQEPLPPIKPEEIPYEVPKGWEWMKLGNLVSIQTGKKDVNEGHANGIYPFFSCAAVPLKSNNYSFDCEALLLPGNGANVGLVTYYNGKFEAYQRTYVLNNFIKILPQFIEKFLNANFLKSLEGKQFGSAINYIKIGNLLDFFISLPPLAEQKRIVTKIDQLMALCDKLEAQRNERNRKRLTVHTSSMNRLLTAPDKTTFDTSWQFITKHFGELYSVTRNVAELKKAILTLAMQGKLVPQDPNDQPASELLKEIESEKKRLVKEGKIKVAALSADRKAIKAEDIPFDLPTGWEWCRLGDIVLKSEAGKSFTCEKYIAKYPSYGVIKVSAISWNKFNELENKALPNFIKPNLDYKINNGDYLISRANTDELIGKSVIVENISSNLLLSDKSIRMIFSEKISKYYINIFNNSIIARLYYKKVATGTSDSMKNISREQMYNLFILLPPLAEQKRIVAKIDQLMELCDTLDKQITSATAKQTAIFNAVLAKIEFKKGIVNEGEK